MKLGSLFDGIGGFPLVGSWLGFEPVWASEIEEKPISITKKHFPNMQHLGDITKINGAKIEPVDLITFGSPCQDLSVAGKRAGLEGSRSNLFLDAVRIIYEMRDATNGEYPKFAVWENVPGAFSSNKGLDFCAVLSEITQTDIPMPESGRWATAGMVRCQGVSIAWRVLDAQYWGVPQRRKRIFLVADFRDEHRPEILFEREGVSRNFAPCGSPWKRVAGHAENGSGAAVGNERIASTLTAAYGTKWNGNSGAYSGDNFAFDCPFVLNDQGGERMDVSEDTTATLRAEAHHPPVVTQSSGFCTEHSAKSGSVGYEEERTPTLRAGVVPGVAIENHPIDGRCKIETDGKVQTLPGRMGTGGGNVPLCMQKCYGICSQSSNSMKSDNPHSGIYETEVAKTLDGNAGNPSCNQGGICVVFNEETVTSPTNSSAPKNNDPCHTLGASGAGRCICIQGNRIDRADTAGCNGKGWNDEEVSYTLNTVDRSAVCYENSGFGKYAEGVGILRASEGDLGGGSESIIDYHAVRRLTPLECERLQGFPDYWTLYGADDEEISDTQRYKALGNSVALPCVEFVLTQIFIELLLD